MKNWPIWFLLLASPGWAQEADVTVTSDRSTYFLGENVLLDFRVHNPGKKALQIEWGGDYRGAPRDLRFKVEAFDQKGNLLSDPHPNSTSFGGLGGTFEVQPGKSFIQSLALAHYRRIPRAGRYRIVVSHDLGWKTPGMASTELEFRQPAPAQAEQVVAEAQKMPLQAGVSLGQKTPPYRDFWTLSYACYLRPLAALATNESLIGMGQIPSPEVVPVLLRLARKPALRLEAARQLCLRIPGRGWKPSFAPQVRALALEFVTVGDAKLVSAGAFLLARVGQPADLGPVSKALNRYLPAVSTYPRPAGPGHDLEQALAALNGPVKIEGSAMLLKQLMHRPVSAEWIERGLHDRSARVRELAVLASTPGGPQRSRLLELLKDADPGVQVAACEKLGGEPAILELVQTTRDEWVLRAAVAACTPRHRWSGAQILAGRLIERERWRTTFLALAEQVMTRVPGSSSDGDPEDSELLALSQRWQHFLTLHRAELEQGKTFAKLPAELIPSKFSFSAR